MVILATHNREAPHCITQPINKRHGEAASSAIPADGNSLGHDALASQKKAMLSSRRRRLQERDAQALGDTQPPASGFPLLGPLRCPCDDG